MIEENTFKRQSTTQSGKTLTNFSSW